MRKIILTGLLAMSLGVSACVMPPMQGGRDGNDNRNEERREGPDTRYEPRHEDNDRHDERRGGSDWQQEHQREQRHGDDDRQGYDGRN